MSKTVQSLDELGASLITLIPTWLNMLKSTRVLTLIGTAIGLFIEYQYTGGFSTTESIGLAALTSITGVSFMGFKSLRPSVTTEPEKEPMGFTAPAAPIPSVATIPAPIITITPFNPGIVDEFVDTKTLQSYGNTTAAAKFFTAMNWLNYGVKFDNGKAYTDAIDYIEVKYALPAFKEIWGKTYDEALTASEQAIIDGQPCILTNIDRIAAYLNAGRREILDGLRDLRSLRSEIQYRLDVDKQRGG